MTQARYLRFGNKFRRRKWTCAVVALAAGAGLLLSWLRLDVRLSVVGCELIRADGSCVPKAAVGESLWLHIDSSASARIKVLADDQLMLATEHPVGRGHLFELQPKAGTQSIKVSVRDGFRYGRGTIALGKRSDPDWLTAVWQLRAHHEDRVRALAIVQSHQGEACTAETTARMLSLRGRIAFDEDRLADAETLLRQAIAADHRAQLLSDEIEDVFWLARLLSKRLFRLAEAEQVIREHQAQIEQLAQTAPWATYYLALFHYYRGNLREALDLITPGRQLAKQTGNNRGLIDLSELGADVLGLLGRQEDARHWLLDLAKIPQRSCRPIYYLLAQSDIRLRAAETLRLGERLPAELDPRPFLHDALKLVSDPRQCSQKRLSAVVLTGLGRAALVMENFTEARQQVERARADLPMGDAELQLDWLEILAQSALGQGNPQEAYAIFTQLGAAASRLNAEDAQWRAMVGLAAAARAMGDRSAARKRFEAAESYLDRRSLAMPLGMGRGGFLARYARGTSLYIDLLAEDPLTVPQALRVARHARARGMQALAAMERLSRLSWDERKRYDAVVDSFGRTRAEIEQLVQEEEKGSVDEARLAREQRDERGQKLLRLLDDAVDILGQGAVAALPREPAEDEVLFTCHPIHKGWLCMMADAHQVHAHRLDFLDINAAKSKLSQQLLQPFSAMLTHARRLSVIAYGPMREIDIHLLPFGPQGQPLWSQLEVSYALDLPGINRSADLPERSAPHPAFLLIDPEGQFPAMFRATPTIESALQRGGWSIELVTQSVERWGSWQGQKPTPRALSAANLTETMSRVELFVSATHADFSPNGGWQHSLRLGSGAGLLVGDILALQKVPRFVTLFGCETARSAEEVGDLEGLGLAQAFLARHSEWTLGTVRVIDPKLAAQVAAAFFSAWTLEHNPVKALRSAVASTNIPVADSHSAIKPEQDIGAFRIYMP